MAQQKITLPDKNLERAINAMFTELYNAAMQTSSVTNSTSPVIPPLGRVVWGSIIGALIDQADLWAALHSMGGGGGGVDIIQIEVFT
jgi:hypothetical protein